jgi:hypothetical protein
MTQSNNADKKSSGAKRPRKKPVSPHYKANDDGGFGNPPVKNQFQLGNKKGGRKKGERNIEAALRRALSGKIDLKDGRSVNTTDALASRLVKLALSGTLSALKEGLALAEKYGPQPESPLPPVDYGVLSEAELNVYLVVLHRLSNTSLADMGLDNDSADLRDMLGHCEVFVRDNGFIGIEYISREKDSTHMPTANPTIPSDTMAILGPADSADESFDLDENASWDSAIMDDDY